MEQKYLVCLIELRQNLTYQYSKKDNLMAVQINTAFVVDIIIALLSRSVTVSCSHPVLRVPEKLDVLTNTRSFKTNMSVKIH